ncbi:MAG: hypothetical protein A2Y38_03430 [Spirochaetes bacterium GWB1_59_5]|nr:MAG: hypothetical protein A2Y38_03430 [Spirochaetes bacterium GWB1_59_5]
MAKMSAVVRLSRRGFIVWEADGILARSTEAQGKADFSAQQMTRKLLELGLNMAKSIRERVRDRGDLGAGQSFPGYGPRRRLIVSLRYANLANTATDKWNQLPTPVLGKNGKVHVDLTEREFTSSRVFHRLSHTKDGSYNVTGGMWRGLQVRTPGGGHVKIDFNGTSPGTMGNVRNDIKAGAIYDAHSVHILKPTAAELRIFNDAVAEHFNDYGLRVLFEAQPRTRVAKK